MPIERDEACAIMSAFPTGLAIVTALDEHGAPRRVTTNAVACVSADPPIRDQIILTGHVEGESPPGHDDVPIVWFGTGFSSAPSPVSVRSDAA